MTDLAHIWPRPKYLLLQMDADRLAWAYANLTQGVETCQKGIERYCTRLLETSGAKKVYLHVSLGNKGGREVVARTRGYQANRVGKVDEKKRERITLLRHFISEIDVPGIKGVRWDNQEADDGICQMQFLSFESCIASADKDLRMCEGWHYDEKTDEYWHADAFGHLVLEEKSVGKKVWGCGTKWFWQQMLQGDVVDNIPGLEFLGVNTLNKFFPIKNAKGRKPQKCGAVRAYNLLSSCKSDAECYYVVSEAYKDCYGLSWKDRLFEQSFLLWMRRQENIFDCLEFLKPLGFEYEVPQDIMEELKPWLNMT